MKSEDTEMLGELESGPTKSKSDPVNQPERTALTIVHR